MKSANTGRPTRTKRTVYDTFHHGDTSVRDDLDVQAAFANEYSFVVSGSNRNSGPHHVQSAEDANYIRYHCLDLLFAAHIG